jgi:hypothetical protein
MMLRKQIHYGGRTIWLFTIMVHIHFRSGHVDYSWDKFHTHLRRGFTRRNIDGALEPVTSILFVVRFVQITTSQSNLIGSPPTKVTNHFSCQMKFLCSVQTWTNFGASVATQQFPANMSGYGYIAQPITPVRVTASNLTVRRSSHTRKRLRISDTSCNKGVHH